LIHDIIEEENEKIIIGKNSKLDVIFVAFRGTSNLENWIDDIQVSKTCFENNVCIETGFYKLYQKLNYSIMKGLSGLQNRNLLITGHSLGSALATILSYDLCNTYNITLITFGSPRVGNKEFVNNFKDCNIISKRVTHYYDIVPHLPEESLNYKHIPGEIWYNEDNSIYKVCDDNKNEDNTCANSCFPFYCTSISDHLYYLNITMGENGVC
jgi:predicted lipase